MTLYYAIVFLILVLEILYFLILMLPLPTAWRKAMFRFLSTSPEIAHIKYILKIVFVFIFVLFLDSVNRLRAIDAAIVSSAGGEADANALGGAQAMHDVRTDAAYSATKFYAQRNMYLTGSTLFLLLILNHTYNITVDLVRLQDQVAGLSQVPALQESSVPDKEKDISVERLKRSSSPPSSEDKKNI